MHPKYIIIVQQLYILGFHTSLSNIHQILYHARYDCTLLWCRTFSITFHIYNLLLDSHPTINLYK